MSNSRNSEASKDESSGLTNTGKEETSSLSALSSELGQFYESTETSAMNDNGHTDNNNNNNNTNNDDDDDDDDDDDEESSNLFTELYGSEAHDQFIAPSAPPLNADTTTNTTTSDNSDLMGPIETSHLIHHTSESIIDNDDDDVVQDEKESNLHDITDDVVPNAVDRSIENTSLHTDTVSPMQDVTHISSAGQTNTLRSKDDQVTNTEDTKQTDEDKNVDENDDDEDESGSEEDDIQVLLSGEAVRNGIQAASLARIPPNRYVRGVSENQLAADQAAGTNENQDEHADGGADEHAETEEGEVVGDELLLSGTGSNAQSLSAASTSSRPRAVGSLIPPVPIDARGREMPLPSVYDIDIDTLDEKPWRSSNADKTDWFNYGFDEETWRVYCQRQVQLRSANSRMGKIRVFDSSNGVQGRVLAGAPWPPGSLTRRANGPPGPPPMMPYGGRPPPPMRGSGTQRGPPPRMPIRGLPPMMPQRAAAQLKSDDAIELGGASVSNSAKAPSSSEPVSERNNASGRNSNDDDNERRRSSRARSRDRTRDRSSPRDVHSPRESRTRSGTVQDRDRRDERERTDRHERSRGRDRRSSRDRERSSIRDQRKRGRGVSPSPDIRSKRRR